MLSKHGGLDRAARKVIGDTMHDLRERALETIEPTATAEAGWKQHCIDCASLTLFPKASSWYMGANVPASPASCSRTSAGVAISTPGVRRGARARVPSFRLRRAEQVAVQ